MTFWNRLQYAFRVLFYPTTIEGYDLMSEVSDAAGKLNEALARVYAVAQADKDALAAAHAETKATAAEAVTAMNGMTSQADAFAPPPPVVVPAADPALPL
jgi:hypothetical protein